MDTDGRVRLFLYEALVASGRVPPNREVAEALDLEVRAVEESLVRLESLHALALAPGSRNPWMLHPFSSVPTSFRVEAQGRSYWGNCAWDAVAIPSLVGGRATAHGKCADCGESMTFELHEGELASGDGLVHLAVPPRRFWENVGFT